MFAAEGRCRGALARADARAAAVRVRAVLVGVGRARHGGAGELRRREHVPRCARRVSARARGLAGQSLAWGLWEPSGTGMTRDADARRISRGSAARASRRCHGRRRPRVARRGARAPRAAASCPRRLELPRAVRAAAPASRARPAMRPDRARRRLAKLAFAERRSRCSQLVRAEARRGVPLAGRARSPTTSRSRASAWTR